MARSNSPASLENWSKKAGRAIYRASVGPKSYWDGNRPSPSLAVAGKVCPGGRMLLAFDMEELRDYFVEGHADNGVQAEPDLCEKASPYRQIAVASAPRATDLETSIPIYVTARKALDEAYKAIERVFNGPFQALMDADKVKQAIAVINAMPDTYLRSSAIGQLLASKKWDTEKNPIGHIDPAPYSREQAAALIQLQRAKKADRIAGDIHGKFAMERAEVILAEDGEEALREFAATLPPSIARAHMAVMERQAARNRDKPASYGPKM
ncbi:hypothetical protein [Rhizobium sp. BK176]|uniref:hypothetical protein n=1 Tax=Rhizobium sp. BK176 TaxID=2587071 RepID=UPI002166D75C|nr:hypothetical protein [Rhizobium sp. BK176]MCS4088433.1 hypothetical protein [Rhizobium sp. BK176]